MCDRERREQSVHLVLLKQENGKIGEKVTLLVSFVFLKILGQKTIFCVVFLLK